MHVDDEEVTEDIASALRGFGVAVLIPCYNEAATIAKVVSDFRAGLARGHGLRLRQRLHRRHGRHRRRRGRRRAPRAAPGQG